MSLLSVFIFWYNIGVDFLVKFCYDVNLFNILFNIIVILKLLTFDEYFKICLKFCFLLLIVIIEVLW